MEFIKCKFCKSATIDKNKLLVHILNAHPDEIMEKIWVNDDEFKV